MKHVLIILMLTLPAFSQTQGLDTVFYTADALTSPKVSKHYSHDSLIGYEFRVIQPGYTFIDIYRTGIKDSLYHPGFDFLSLHKGYTLEGSIYDSLWTLHYKIYYIGQSDSIIVIGDLSQTVPIISRFRGTSNGIGNPTEYNLKGQTIIGRKPKHYMEVLK